MDTVCEALRCNASTEGVITLILHILSTYVDLPTADRNGYASSVVSLLFQKNVAQTSAPSFR